jgi:hypothetical protein
MKTIPYSVKLDIKTMSAHISKELNDAEKARIELKQVNMERLIPFVAEFVHYLVDINNQAIIGGSYGNDRYVRLLGINDGKLIHSEVIKDKLHECHFDHDGTGWSTRIMENVTIKIWLNSRRGAVVHTPNLPYSMTRLKVGGAAGDNVYGESVEKVAHEILVFVLKIAK